MIKETFELQELIDFLDETPEDSWLVDKVRSKDQKKNCVMGHIYAFCAGGYDKDGGSAGWDYFEECYATTYMIYPVNDGENAKYQQSTPKQRVLAYLRDLRDGKEKTTPVLWKESEEMMRTISRIRKELIEEVKKILVDEINITHAHKRGKTSGLTSAYNRVSKLNE